MKHQPLAADAAQALQGVTDGPWTYEGPDHSVIVWSDADHRVCFMTSDGNGPANARFIAFARAWVPEAAAALTALAAQVEELTRERDEADRRAGAAARKMEDLKDSAMRRSEWLYKAKADRGYSDNVSFDIVWAETCAKADRAEAAEAKLARLESLQFPADWRERAHSFKGMLKLQAAWADGFNAARAALTEGKPE